MIRMLIVDDETATRNGLLHHVDWKAMGVDMIQTAGGGQEAIDMCIDFEPDLVLSDIRMRGMNGVEMCTILHERFPECRIIFISGYSDKEYLKAAIELGAVNYVEKPVDTEELKRAVQKAMEAIFDARRHRSEGEQLSRNSAYIKREAFFSLLRGETSDEEVIKNIEKSGLFSGGYPLMRICIFRCSGEVTNIGRFRDALWRAANLSGFQGDGCSVHGEFWDNRRFVLLACGTKETIGEKSRMMQAVSKVCANEIDGLKLFFAVGKLVDSPQKLCHSYQSAHEAEKTIFFLGYGKTATRGRMEKAFSLSDDYNREFRKALSAGNEAEIKEALLKMDACLRDGEAVASAFIQGVYYELEREINEEYQRLFPEKQEKISEKMELGAQRLRGLDTLDSINDFLFTQVHEMLEQSSRDESNNSVVMRVTRMIQQDFGNRNLSVKQLAESIYLTPTYLSGLFKRKTGKTIGEFLTTVRIERAKELLCDPQLKLYNVAEQVGYEDANYFAKIFKKQTGTTPSEYRERNRL